MGLIEILTFWGQSYAQTNTSLLSLADAISKATQNNRAVTIAKLDEQMPASNYKKTEAICLPRVSLSNTAMSTNNPLNSFGFKLQQKSISQADFNSDFLNHPNGTPDLTTKLEVQKIIN